MMNYGGEGGRGVWEYRLRGIGAGRSMVYGFKEEVWATLGRGTKPKARSLERDITGDSDTETNREGRELINRTSLYGDRAIRAIRCRCRR